MKLPENHPTHIWGIYNDAPYTGMASLMYCKGCGCHYESIESEEPCPKPYISFLQWILNYFKRK